MNKVLGYVKARNLMKQLDWKMVVEMDGEYIERITVYHPKQPNVYTVRKDSGAKLIAECRVVKRLSDRKAILCFDHDGSNEKLI